MKRGVPGVCSVGKNAEIDNARETTCPIIASAAAPVPREFRRNKIDNEAASGTAGISQMLLTIQEFIL